MRFLPLLFALLILPGAALRSPVSAPQPPAANAGGAPVLGNPGFECGDGYHDELGVHGMVPNGWTEKVLEGAPFTVSTQLWAKTGGCDPRDMNWEKLEGYDSNIFMASWAPYGQDFDSPPFDVALSQPVQVQPGTDYSLSAWMTSLCGGSSNPNDCPPGAYIAKMAGLDPAGGTDPLAKTIQWTEDRRPHTEVRWTDLVIATTAETSTLTVFLRIDSPFHHHGNHAFADAVRLVRSPVAQITAVGAPKNSISVTWNGTLGPDIPAIPATNHKLSFEIEMRSGDAAWQPWQSSQTPGAATFSAPRSCFDQAYQFRIRAWAIQPAGQPGAWPNHHFVSPWHESQQVQVARVVACQPTAYLPAMQK